MVNRYWSARHEKVKRGGGYRVESALNGRPEGRSLRRKGRRGGNRCRGHSDEWRPEEGLCPLEGHGAASLAFLSRVCEPLTKPRCRGYSRKGCMSGEEETTARSHEREEYSTHPDPSRTRADSRPSLRMPAKYADEAFN